MTTRAVGSKDSAPLLRHRIPIEHNVYFRAVTFLYGSRDQINAALRRDTPRGERFSPLAPSCVGHWRVIEHDGHQADYLCLVSGRGATLELPALAHEVLHHTAHALEMAGMTLTGASEEAYCYYLQWVIAQCLVAIRDRR